MAALTTVTAVKEYLGTKTAESDSLLSELVDRASAAIENFCQRSLGLADREDICNGHGGTTMLLKHSPVVAVSSVVIDGESVPATGFRLAGRTLVLNGWRFTRGEANVQVNYRAGFEQIPADVEQACIETAALMFRRRDHVDVSSKTLAGETVAYIAAELTPSARQILQNYRLVAPL